MSWLELPTKIHLAEEVITPLDDGVLEDLISIILLSLMGLSTRCRTSAPKLQFYDWAECDGYHLVQSWKDTEISHFKAISHARLVVRCPNTSCLGPG